MFSFFRFGVRRARTIVQHVMSGLERGVQDLSPVDRAAVLSIVNGLIDLTADKWGEQVASDPGSIKPEVLADIVIKLAETHSRTLVERLEPVQERGMGDVSYAQAMRQVRAFEVTIATLGRYLIDGSLDPLTRSWKLLAASRSNANEAAISMMRFAALSHSDPVPTSRRLRGPVKEADVVRLATSLPLFLTKRRPAPAPVKSSKPVARGLTAGGKTGSAVAAKPAGKRASKPGVRDSVDRTGRR